MTPAAGFEVVWTGAMETQAAKAAQRTPPTERGRIGLVARERSVAHPTTPHQARPRRKGETYHRREEKPQPPAAPAQPAAALVTCQRFPPYGRYAARVREVSQVMAQRRGYPWTVHELAELLDRPDASVAGALYALTRSGQVEVSRALVHTGIPAQFRWMADRQEAGAS